MISSGQQQRPASTQFGLTTHAYCDSLPAAAAIQMAVLLKPQAQISGLNAQCQSGGVIMHKFRACNFCLDWLCAIVQPSG